MTTTLFAQDIDYWNHKVKAFLHDPPDKAIQIPGHEARANRILDALAIQSSLDPAEYQQADIIASGMDRTVLPGFAKKPEKNGAIDFCDSPAVTHPCGSDAPLRIKLPVGNRQALISEIGAAMERLIRKDVGQYANGRGLSEKPLYKNNEKNFASARFMYLFFLLRQRLAKENIGGLGGLWHRLPADTRIPDHSIWQHSGLVSALASCFRLSEKYQASLMVFALTPVQDFVGRARKLRDYWSGSLLLSWLAFEGIKAVIYQLGPDHILYPGLHGQPLVHGLLRQWQMNDLMGSTPSASGVASFPNKFVCLVPTGREEETAALIEQSIQKQWLELGRRTRELVEKIVDRQDEYIRKQFDRQMGSYWEYHWSAVPLVRKESRAQVEQLLHRGSIEGLFRFVEDTDNLLLKQGIKPGSGEGQMYSISHRLVQSMLAAGKSHRRDRRQKEPGIKCDMFGEFEILHFTFQDNDDQNPRPTDDPFWTLLKQNWDTESDFGRTERLCAIGLVKRLAYRVCQDIKNHPLKPMFEKADTFPSTTEVALHDWWEQLKKKAQQDSELATERAEFSDDNDRARQQLAQWFYEIDEPEQVERQGRQIITTDAGQRAAAEKIIGELHKVKNVHKYYGVLMMDGDRMGSLVNGETLGAGWENVLHPVLVKRLQGDFEQNYHQFWQKYLAKIRLISPAVHAAVSECLGDFSLLSVPRIVEEKYQGRLIYAGGDDLCAIMPVSTILDAAREIAGAYCRGFVFQDSRNRELTPLSGEWMPEPGKLAIHLGRGDQISISAGIMIASHKKPLARVIDRAHQLLELAKKEGGRNGFALELDKRSGGGRLFMARWHDRGSANSTTILEHFNETAKALQAGGQTAMSTSLAYRLAMFEDGLLPLLNRQRLLKRFVLKQLDRSELKESLPEDEQKKRLEETAVHVAELLAHQNRNAERLQAEALVIANFMGKCRQEREAAQ